MQKNKFVQPFSDGFMVIDDHGNGGTFPRQDADRIVRELAPWLSGVDRAKQGVAGDALLEVTRLEVIGDAGRLLTLRPVVVESVQFQDDDRTLKIFVKVEGLASSGEIEPDAKAALAELSTAHAVLQRALHERTEDANRLFELVCTAHRSLTAAMVQKGRPLVERVDALVAERDRLRKLADADSGHVLADKRALESTTTVCEWRPFKGDGNTSWRQASCRPDTLPFLPVKVLEFKCCPYCTFPISMTPVEVTK